MLQCTNRTSNGVRSSPVVEYLPEKVLLNSNELMLLLKFCIIFIGLFSTSHRTQAASIPVQMPESSFDGAHTKRWIHQSVNRIPSSHSSLAYTASWYGVQDGFHGRRTASGEVFNAYALTAAHRTLPFGTLVRVVNLNNGRSVVVRINDRGPYNYSRSIDLSEAAAGRIGMFRSGTAPVQLQVIR